MKIERLRNRRTLGAAAVSAGLLVPLGVFGAPALAHTTAAQYQYKIQICHHTHSAKHPMHTIWVSANAWKGHSHHAGDTMGPCPPAAPVSAPAPTSPTHGHGHHK